MKETHPAPVLGRGLEDSKPWSEQQHSIQCALHRLESPWGTEESPVAVASAFTERVVGVPDPYDDSIIWWGTIKEGEPPRQIVEGGEFFVLKRTPEEDSHGH